jgi:predicted PurR-regulated permease PerM
MNATPPDPNGKMENYTFLLLLVLVTMAFVWVLLPFYGAIFWGVVMAIVFAPVYRRLLPRLRGSATLAALVTLAVVLVIVILPLALIAGALVNEGTWFYRQVQSGDISFSRYIEQILPSVPEWLMRLLDRLGLGDFAAWQRKITESATQGSRIIATRALDIGQNTLDFVISFGISLYLSFFLLRDGASLARRIWEAVPLDADSKRRFFRMFATVIRATIKGNILVAALQGALGGLAFWYLGVHGAVLWGTLMAFMSLLPAIGAALIWAPVAVYFSSPAQSGRAWACSSGARW